MQTKEATDISKSETEICKNVKKFPHSSTFTPDTDF